MSQRISPNEECWGNQGQDTRNLSKNMYSELLNSTSATEAHLMIQTNTPYLSSTPRPIAQGGEEPVEDTSCLTPLVPAGAGTTNPVQRGVGAMCQCKDGSPF
ncbi:hypothetical protein EK904_002141, partial [Melospiza melodia maxima]